MNKVMGIEEAVGRVSPGASVMVGGFMAVGTPESLMDEVVRQGIGGLTVICNDAGTPGVGAGKLVRANLLARYITSHIGLNPELGQRMNDGRVEVLLLPQGTLAERIRCGGAGLGGILTPTGVGTAVQEGKQLITVEGKDYLLELPLKAEVALIKAHRGDRSGNLIFRKSARNFNPVMAPACAYVIAEVEHIEDTGTLDPDAVMLPGIFVDALVQSLEVSRGK